VICHILTSDRLTCMKATASNSTRPISPEQWWRTPCLVAPNVIVSGDLDGASLEKFSTQLNELLEMGVTDIIDVRAEASDENLVLSLRPDVKYHHIATDDDGYQQPDAWFERGVAAALNSISTEEGKIFVHCHMGVNRAPSLAFAILLSLGYQPVEALKSIREARPIAAMIYALDALDWWQRSNSVDLETSAYQRDAVYSWMLENPIDTRWIISKIATSGMR
jgi:dual specificity phosphatase 3